MKKILVALATSLLLVACVKDHDLSPKQFFGPKVQMGNGTAQSWLALDAAGAPQSIGFTLSKNSLDNLPTAAAMSDFMLALPTEAADKTPFQFIMINWNAMGHEPPGIYDVPHFDFHFYMAPMSEVMSIPPYGKAPAKFDNLPAKDYLPVGFAKNPAGVPGMGAHWSDLSSPEFKGGAFTETFVYGSYDGHVTFWEQMVTLSYMKSSPKLDREIKLPAKYEKPGYYPTRYSIQTKADGSQEVALSQFVKR